MTSSAPTYQSAGADPLAAASQRLTESVEALTDETWSAPSLLPGWSRGHVVAHLTLNAEGLAAALIGAVEGRSQPMYASDEVRDGDIDELARGPRAQVVRRFVVAAGRFDEALAAVAAAPGQVAERLIPRTPGGRRFPVAATGEMRLREVEVHHVDLDLGYSPADWPTPFVRDLLTHGIHRPLRIDALLSAIDIDWSHQLGTGGPTITGPAHGLAWWLTGRDPFPGAEPTSDEGALPRIEAL